MNKLSLAAVSAALLVAPAALAGPLGVPAPFAGRVAAMPRMPALASARVVSPAGEGWLKYNTQVYPREVQYWAADGAYIAASTTLDFVYDVNDPCGQSSCAPAQNPQKFVAAERAVAQTAPQRAQRIGQAARVPPLPRLP